MSRKRLLLVLLLGGCATLTDGIRAKVHHGFPEPRGYQCPRAATSPAIDGRIDEAVWERAAWSEDYVDIRGEAGPDPWLRTRMKLLWDDTHLYVAADMEEPHLWGTLTERDSVIYHDNDFEVFVDPDGDTHRYYELEINALGTVWDLFLVKPYRDGGPAMNAWHIHGLKSAVHLDGTLNDPSDEDRGWSVEIAIPWDVLKEAAGTRTPPEPGDRWRMNFSRVHWDLEVVDGAYRKVEKPKELAHPEHNWVWSPQGEIAMHQPETWGIVEFVAERKRYSVAEEGGDVVEVEGLWTAREEEVARLRLFKVYRLQHAYREEHGRWAGSLDALRLPVQGVGHGWAWRIELEATDWGWDAWATSSDGSERLHLREDGRIRRVKPE